MTRMTTCNYPRRNCDLIDPLIKYPYADQFLPLTTGRIVEIDTWRLYTYSDAGDYSCIISRNRYRRHRGLLTCPRKSGLHQVCNIIPNLSILSLDRDYNQVMKLWSIASKNYSIKRIIYCYVAFIISICKY